MQESVVYNQIIEKGIQQGIQQRKNSEIQLLIRQLTRRLGNLNSQFQEKIEGLSFEELENLGLDLLDFNDESDLINWLEVK